MNWNWVWNWTSNWNWSLNWIDAIFAGILLLSVLIGAVRGFLYEVMSLLGWVVAYYFALWAAPQWANQWPVGVPHSTVNSASALVITFVLALFLWGLCTRLVRWLVQTTPLSFLDRTSGAFFGLCRGGLISLCVVMLVSLTPLAHHHLWLSASSVQSVRQALITIKPWLPSDLRRFFTV